MVLREGEPLVLDVVRPTLLFVLQGGRAEVVATSRRWALDRATWMLVGRPARSGPVRVRAASPVAHLLGLSVADALVASVAETYAGELDERRLRTHLTQTARLPRTTWVNELAYRYLFERAACRKRDNIATRFLETEIVKELYFHCEERERGQGRASHLETHGAVVSRALAVVEAQLFEPDLARRLPKEAGASASTLLRAFQRELGVAPLVYVRRRRLDEAMALLKSGRRSVSEVAAAVGYASFAAFSQAFRLRFGQRPSDVARERDHC